MKTLSSFFLFISVLPLLVVGCGFLIDKRPGLNKVPQSKGGGGRSIAKFGEDMEEIGPNGCEKHPPERSLFWYKSSVAGNVKKKYRRSDFWAQQYVGGDLLREKLKLLGIEGNRVLELIQIWDGEGRNKLKHGEGVSSLIAGPHSSAIIPLSENIPYLDLFSGGHVAKRYQTISQTCASPSNVCPRYVNNSAGWGGYGVINDYVSRMVDQYGTVMVTSGGNGHMPISPLKTKLAAEGKIIIVGSLDSIGNPTFYTNYSYQVTISAPSLMLASYDFDEEKKQPFSGTSAGAPLVTGALASFTLISGYSLNTREATQLLEKTAIPLKGLPSANRMGHGMLNAYKIGAVALRLKDKCGERKECITEALLSDKGLYAFPIENREQLFEDGARVFAARCFRDYRGNRGGSGQGKICKKRALNALRRAAFLNPFDAEIWETIACLKVGVAEEKKFYNALAERATQTDEEIIAKIVDRSAENFLYINNIVESKLRSRYKYRYLLAPTLLTILENSKLKKDHLEKIAEAVDVNAREMSQLPVLLETIVKHPQTNEIALAHITGAALARPDAISDIVPFLQGILKDKRVQRGKGRKLLERIAEAAMKNADKISLEQMEILWETLLRDSRMTSDALKYIAEAAIKKADEMLGFKLFFENILSHEKMNEKVLEFMAEAVIDNEGSISAPQTQNLLASLLQHADPKASTEAVKYIAGAAITNANDFSNIQAFMQTISQHDNFKSQKVLAYTTKRAVLSIDSISKPRTVLPIVFGHLDMNESILMEAANLMLAKGYLIYDLEILGNTIVNHPMVKGNAKKFKTIVEEIAKELDKRSKEQG